VDTIAARRRTAAEMTRLTERTTDPLARIWALDRSVHAAAESGGVAAAVEACDRLRGLTEELAQPGLRWHATYYACGLALLRGDIDEADRLAEAASRLGARAGEPDTILVYAGQIAAIRVEQGRPEEVVEMLEQAVAHNPGIPAFESGLAATLCEAGRIRDAAALVERAGEEAMAAAPRDQVYSTALATWARAVAEVGAERPAARLYDLIEPWRDLVVWNGTTGYGAAESYLGMLAATLGSADRAAAHFAAAARLYRREGMRGWEARDRCHQAGALRAAGEDDRAREAAEDALAMAHEGGRPGLIRRAEALLQATADAASPR
jgi:tetratricopeptide (TPR) repeat protein